MRRPGSEGIWYVVALPVCSRFQMVEGDVAYRRLWNQATRDTMLDAGAAWTSLIALLSRQLRVPSQTGHLDLVPELDTP